MKDISSPVSSTLTVTWCSLFNIRRLEQKSQMLRLKDLMKAYFSIYNSSEPTLLALFIFNPDCCSYLHIGECR